MIKKIKTSTILVLLITLINSSALALYFRFNNQQISQKNFEVNSLIDEIGQLKQQNQTLYQQVQNQNQNIEYTNQNIENLSYQVGGLKDQKVANQSALVSLQNTLSQATSSFQNQLAQKENAIDSLKTQQEVDSKKKEIATQIDSFLLLGENHKLTDTIMLVVIDKVKQKISLISIPRDLYYNGRKINEYYEFYGFDKIKEVVGDVTGITPNHYIYVNFQGFIDFVNLLGGIDVNIPKSFEDPYYPTSDYGYKKVSFSAGTEHMDGARALEYARSRKTTSDYDRAARQQLILVTVKQKIASMGVIKNINYYSNIFDIVSKNTKTDLNFLDLVTDFENYKGYDLSAGNVMSSENFLKASKSITGQFILLPKSGNYLDLQKSILGLI